MSEEQNFQGDQWTDLSLSILKNLGWEQRGTKNFDIACKKKVAHSTGINPRKNPHGIDLIFSFFDPYKKESLTVLTECKNRNWAGINNSTTQEFVTQLLTAIECANISSELGFLEDSRVHTGLLMVWCNEVDKFDSIEFQKYLNNVNITNRKLPISIYVASNKEILRWCSVISKVKNIKSLQETIEFEFYYPGDSYSGGHTVPHRENIVTLNHLFSNYIFAKEKQQINNRNASYVKDINHVFFFSEPTLEELNFMYDCIRKFQFDDADEIVIHLFKSDSKYRIYIDEFIANQKKKYKENNVSLEISIDFLEVFKEVPESF